MKNDDRSSERDRQVGNPRFPFFFIVKIINLIISLISIVNGESQKIIIKKEKTDVTKVKPFNWIMIKNF